VRGKLALGFGIAILLAGCGGGDGSSDDSTLAPALNPAAVRGCLLRAGAEPEALAPLRPDGAPRHPQHVFFEGPVTGHIAIFLAPKPIFTERLAKAYTAIQEYRATVARGGRALILLDPGSPNPNRALAFRCVVG
jgi:hypothetical protein